MCPRTTKAYRMRRDSLRLHTRGKRWTIFQICLRWMRGTAVSSNLLLSGFLTLCPSLPHTLSSFFALGSGERSSFAWCKWESFFSGGMALGLSSHPFGYRSTLQSGYRCVEAVTFGNQKLDDLFCGHYEESIRQTLP